MAVYPSGVPTWTNTRNLLSPQAISDEVTAIASRMGGWYNVAAYGAVPNDASKAQTNSDAFRKAMAAAWSAGGGTVFFPQGVWWMIPNTGVGDASGKAVAQAYGDDGTGVGGAYSEKSCGVLLPNCGVYLPVGATCKLQAGWGAGTVADSSNRSFFATVGKDTSQAVTSNHWFFGGGTIDGNAPNVHTDVPSFHGLVYARASYCWTDNITIIDCLGVSGSRKSLKFNGTVQTVDGESFLHHFQSVNIGRVSRCQTYRSSATGTRPNGTSTGFSTTNCTDVVFTDCVAHDITFNNANIFESDGVTVTKGGQGFSHYDSDDVHYMSCSAWSCSAKGFNYEGGENVSYVSCNAGIRTANSGQQPFGLATLYGNGSLSGSTGIGFYFNTSAGGHRWSSADYINCKAIGNNTSGNKAVCVTNGLYNSWSSTTGTGPYTINITNGGSPESNFSSGNVGSRLIIVDPVNLIPRGPWVEITGYTSTTAVTIDYNPFTNVVAGDKVIVLSGQMNWINGEIAYNDTGVGSTVSQNPFRAFTACGLRFSNVRFRKNTTADIAGYTAGGTGSRYPYGVWSTTAGAVATQPTVPATGQLFYNPYPCDMTVYVNSNGCTWSANGIQIRPAGLPPTSSATASAALTQTIGTPASTGITQIKLGAGYGIVLNYSAGAPTWVWAGAL